MRLLACGMATLALLLAFSQSAAGASTLTQLQEPVVATGGSAPLVVDLVITPEEAARSSFVVFSTQPNRGMRASLVAANGTTVWEEPRATNGVRPFAPGAPAGDYKLTLTGTGQLQVTHRYLAAVHDDEPTREVNGTLDGTHAYLFQSSRAWNVHVAGDLNVTWQELAGAQRSFDAPGNVTARAQHVYVATLRGPTGTPYSIQLEPSTDDPSGDEERAATPAPGVAALLLVVALTTIRRGFSRSR